MSSGTEPSTPQDHDPFGVLLNANTALLHNLRRDEASPELQKQLTQTGMPPSAQGYFCDPYTNYLGPQVRLSFPLYTHEYEPQIILKIVDRCCL